VPVSHAIAFPSVNLARNILPGGTYIATINMAGAESGLTFNKTMKMAMNK
jgi:hypothetical protein